MSVSGNSEGLSGGRTAVAETRVPPQDEDLEQGVTGHSRTGVASFAFALIATVLASMAFSAAGGPEPSPLGNQNTRAPLLSLDDVGLVVGIYLYVLGFVLGILAVLREGRKKTFAVLGIALSGLAIAAVLVAGVLLVVAVVVFVIESGGAL